MTKLPDVDTSWTPVRMPQGPTRSYLVIIRTGGNSLHRQWARNTPNSERCWDLLISHYGKSECDDPDAEIIVAQGAFKFSAIHRLYQDIPWLKQYSAVWFCDDDIMTNWADIDRLFKIVKDFGLWLAQPALTKNSYGFWPECYQQSETFLRFTNFVEIMAPVFSAEGLRICLPSFEGKITGHGLDSLWPHLLGYPQTKMAIIDTIGVHHTRPVGSGTIYHEASQMNVTPEIEYEPILRDYQLTQDHREYGVHWSQPRPVNRSVQNSTPFPTLGSQLIKFFKDSTKPARADLWQAHPEGWRTDEKWDGGAIRTYDIPSLMPQDAMLSLGFSINLRQSTPGQMVEIIQLGSKNGPSCLSVRINAASESLYNIFYIAFNENNGMATMISSNVAANETANILLQLMPRVGWACLRFNEKSPLEVSLPPMSLRTANCLVIGNDAVNAEIGNLRIAPALL